jgi:hypothetical protein
VKLLLMERVKLLLLLLLLVEGKMMGVAVVVMLLKWMLSTVAVVAARVAVDRGVDNAVRGILRWYSWGISSGGGGEEWLHVMGEEHLLLLQVRRDGGVDGVGGMRM